jgi:multiple sugar transport system ATP-binding protein
MSMADKIAIMNAGELVQYDEPYAIYSKPASTFVASFIGSPPMNLMKAKVSDSSAGTYLDTGSFKYKLSDAAAKAVKSGGSTDVTLGVRPEDLMISMTKAADSIFDAEIYVVEPLGANTVVDIKVGAEILKAVAGGSFRADAGQKIWVSFPAESLHVFDTKTSLAVF